MSYVLESELEAKRLEKQNSCQLYNVSRELDGIQFTDGEIIMDVGCGTCAMTREILNINPSVKITAVDLSEIRLRQAQKLINPRHKSNVEFVNVDINKNSLKEEQFDSVVNRFVLHHLEDPKILLNAMKRLVKPGGRIVTVDSDGILLNYFSSNSWVMNKLKILENKLPMDLFAARKLRAFYSELNLHDIEVKMIPMHFTGVELTNEIEQYRDRFAIMKDQIDKMLGLRDAKKFINIYLEDLELGRAELFYNKFIAQGYKK